VLVVVLTAMGFVFGSRRGGRYAAMYMGDDPEAPNYDKDKKLIRSLLTGSRGPMLRKATGLDWAGDPLVLPNDGGWGFRACAAGLLLSYAHIPSNSPKSTHARPCTAEVQRVEWRRKTNKPKNRLVDEGADT
jgi:hypothetical protein